LQKTLGFRPLLIYKKITILINPTFSCWSSSSVWTSITFVSSSFILTIKSNFYNHFQMCWNRCPNYMYLLFWEIPIPHPLFNVVSQSLASYFGVIQCLDWVNNIEWGVRGGGRYKSVWNNLHIATDDLNPQVYHQLLKVIVSNIKSKKPLCMTWNKQLDWCYLHRPM
jgi:hypothetical protein